MNTVNFYLPLKPHDREMDKVNSMIDIDWYTHFIVTNYEVTQ